MNGSSVAALVLASVFGVAVVVLEVRSWRKPGRGREEEAE